MGRSTRLGLRIAAAALASLGAVVIDSKAVADGPEVTPELALPLASERLDAPLEPAHCGAILEWRSSGALRAETSPSPEALAVIDRACEVAVARWPEFARARSLPVARAPGTRLPPMSLLPANVLLDGKKPRSLNDFPGRFGAVAPRCCIWGLFVERLDHLFVRNDPMLRDPATGELRENRRFVRTLQHEIGHALAARAGVTAAVGRKRDEELAEDFVGFLGFDYPAESSADDLAFHTGGGDAHAAPARTDGAAERTDDATAAPVAASAPAVAAAAENAPTTAPPAASVLELPLLDRVGERGPRRGRRARSTP